MAQQDLIQKTRFEKQIPFPILASIAAEVKRLDIKEPNEDLSIQFDNIKEQSEDLNLLSIIHQHNRDEHHVKLIYREALTSLIAQSIRAIRLIDNN